MIPYYFIIDLTSYIFGFGNFRCGSNIGFRFRLRNIIIGGFRLRSELIGGFSLWDIIIRFTLRDVGVSGWLRF